MGVGDGVDGPSAGILGFAAVENGAVLAGGVGTVGAAATFVLLGGLVLFCLATASAGLAGGGSFLGCIQFCSFSIMVGLAAFAVVLVAVSAGLVMLAVSAVVGAGSFVMAGTLGACVVGLPKGASPERKTGACTVLVGGKLSGAGKAPGVTGAKDAGGGGGVGSF